MRIWMETRQSWIYLLCIIAGMLLGLNQPEATTGVETVLWLLLALLLYTTFIQIRFAQIGRDLKDWRFLCALLLGNFVAIPLIAGFLTTLFALVPVVKAGVLLVLLVPCTDWFISFTHLGKGDGAQAVAATPVLLLMQLVLLPVYLWLFLGPDWLFETFNTRLLGAFLGLILMPLVLA